MKKIYLLGLASMVALGVNAQSTIKVKNPLKGKMKYENATSKNGNSNSVQQVAGSIACNSQYTAGTSMTLNFTLTLTNTDEEYVDSLSLTFPAGMTPTVAPDPFPGAQTGGQTAEALNGINGQTISWGDNDNSYGGIQTPTPTGGAVTYNFSIDVTIDPALTGNQTANFHMSGDGFGAAPGDLDGTITIFPAGASIDDAAVSLAAVIGTSYCGNTTLPIIARIKNLGNTTISNFPVSYQVDANPAVTETVTATLAPGDSIDYTFTTLADFSAEAAFSVVVSVNLANDVVASNNSFTADWTNTIPVDLASTTMAAPYANDFETDADFLALLVEPGAGTGGNWGLSATTFQSGAQALFLTAAVSNGNGLGDSWIFFKCMNATAGDTYKVKYYTRTNTNFNGGLEIQAGDQPAIANMSIPVKPFTANTANSTWRLDSAEFTSPISSTFYLGFRGQGTATGNGTNVRLDNVKIYKVIPPTIGIKDNTSTDAISIFPNPSNGVFTVKVSENEASMEVYSIIGENVYSSKVVKGNNTVDLSNLAAGSYIVKVNNGGKSTAKRIVINK
jgi:hypothetical protein